MCNNLINILIILEMEQFRNLALQTISRCAWLMQCRAFEGRGFGTVHAVLRIDRNTLTIKTYFRWATFYLFLLQRRTAARQLRSTGSTVKVLGKMTSSAVCFVAIALSGFAALVSGQQCASVKGYIIGNGHDIATHSASSTAECCGFCQNNTECKAWTLEASTMGAGSQCWLHSSTVDIASRSTAISGVPHG